MRRMDYDYPEQVRWARSGKSMTQTEELILMQQEAWDRFRWNWIARLGLAGIGVGLASLPQVLGVRR